MLINVSVGSSVKRGQADVENLQVVGWGLVVILVKHKSRKEAEFSRENLQSMMYI